MMRLLLACGAVLQAAGVLRGLQRPPFGGLQPPVPNGAPGATPPSIASWSSWRVDAQACSTEELQSKAYDLLIFGVTGNLGSRAVQYLMNRRSWSEKPAWAVVVRNANLFKYKMTEMLGESTVAGMNIFEADIRYNVTLLDPIVRQAKVVLNFAGPYEDSGSEGLIKSAVASCAHYVDLATEAKWKRSVLQSYGDLAELRELAVVQGAGFDSTVADMLAMSAADDLSKSGVPAPTHVTVVWEQQNGGIGGTKMLAEQSAVMRHGWVVDPYILSPQTHQELRVDMAVNSPSDPAKLATARILKEPLQPYGGRADTLVIRRSMHLEYPEQPISVSEVCTYKMVAAAQEFGVKMGVNPKPAPGEVPAQQVLEEGSFMGKGIAMHKPDGAEESGPVPFSTVTIEGLGDPHYIASYKIATEIALGLVYDGPRRFGYVTPATVLAMESLEKRLQAVDGGEFMRIKHDE